MARCTVSSAPRRRSRRGGRAVVDETPDLEELRAAGEAIRERAVLRLDELLVRLESAVTAAGGEVHWARDAAEANEVVVGLITGTGAREVVKVKSLTSDELELNDALAKAGIEAIETDLAERIIQLAGERPSHLLVPSLHRSRPEIAELLREALGEPELADDPESLLAAARQHLRQAFLRAPVAVSGANFAVAETGTVAVVESEGNGRMCTTLPETLVTVMGVEKVVEEWRDLGVLMQLLPRSATGERMNPYTSLWTGVCRATGRRRSTSCSSTRAAPGCSGIPMGDRRSGASAAPPASTSARSTGRPAGMRTTRSIRGRSARSCSRSCPASRASRRRCPTPRRSAAPARTCARSGSTSRGSSCTSARRSCAVRARPRGRALRALARAFSSDERYERAQRTARALQRPLVRSGRLRWFPGPLAGWGRSRTLPGVAPQTFREWWEERERGA